MPNEREDQLKKLQEEKTAIKFKIEKGMPFKTRKQYGERFVEIQDEMANLNKLNDDEKNIHAIWIGIPSKDEFDNLKVWVKYNPGYNIHIWTDSTHVLSHKLGIIISEIVKKFNKGLEEYDYQFEADLKDEFYNNCQLKNLRKTFDENAKQFISDMGYAFKSDILGWINQGKTIISQEAADIQRYTTNEVILHDVNQEKDNIFPNENYYDGYLKTLEHLHICASASDRLRYAILDKFGGVYLDTDLSLRFKVDKLESNQPITDLINSVKWSKIYDTSDFLYRKSEIILNQIILLDNLNKLNDENLKYFSKKWEEIFRGNPNNNFKIFNKIAKKFKDMNLNLEPNMLLNDFPIDNYFPLECYRDEKNGVGNAFIISKKDSKILKDAMRKIEITDEKIKNMNTFEKLINKDEMIMYHTGPDNLDYAIRENDDNYSFLNRQNSCKLLSLNTIDSFNSSWLNIHEPHEDAIKDKDKLKSLFLGNTKNFELSDSNRYNLAQKENQQKSTNSKNKLKENESVFEQEF